MMPAGHVAASGIVSVVFLSLSKSVAGAVACFFSGILIDLDHALDFVVLRKKMFRSVQELKDFCLDKKGKIYLFLHSYELFFVLWALAIGSGVSPVYLGILYGMSTHLLLDQVTNTIYPLTYFFYYRSRLGFSKALFFRGQIREFDEMMAKR